MRLVRVLVLLAAIGATLPDGLIPVARAAAMAAAQQPPDRPAPADEFVPIDQLPPQEELPAAPMVVAAYCFIWIAFVAYCLSLVKRVRKVEADLAAIEKGRR